MYKFIIIGAGVSGLAFARLLQLNGEKNFLICEAESFYGGLCRSAVVGSHTIDLGGGHFLCSKFPEVYDFIFSHIPRNEFNVFDRISKIKISESLTVDYPIELNLWQLPEGERESYIKSILLAGESNFSEEPRDFENWIRWKFGDKISNAYMLPYNRKIWGVPPSDLDTDWLEKIPRVSPAHVLESCHRRSFSSEHLPSHAKFLYPKRGGFQRIVDAIFEPLVAKVICGEPVFSLKTRDGKWHVNDKYETKIVINTAPWPKLFHALGAPTALEKDFQQLRANSIVISLWEEQYSHKWHWCYLPDPKLESHREFFVANYALNTQKKGVVTETELKRWPGKGAQWSSGKQPIFEHLVPSAYPIPVLNHRKSIRKILEHFQGQGLYGLGRWGQWQYFNSDVCIWEAMKLYRSLHSR